MKIIFKLVLAAVPLMLIPASTRADDCYGDGGTSANCGYIKKWCNKLTTKIASIEICAGKGPWYSYWPYNAHFMTPAPQFGCHYPYWSAGGVSGGYGLPGGVTGGFGSPGVTAYVPQAMVPNAPPNAMAVPNGGQPPIRGNGP
jgi:hypothetical protein